MSARDCRDELEIEYNTYDQAVDIVSCWESFFNYSYEQVFSDYYFDRFPTLSHHGDDLTPDFSAIINDDYGLIGEIKRTFPDDEKAFRSTLEQLERYDEPDALPASEDLIEPTKCDILLLINGTSAPQIGARIQRLVDNGELQMNRNLVVVRYQYNSRDRLSRYEFQRVTPVEQGFRDSALRDEHSLSYYMGKESDYQTLPLYPKHFMTEKVKKPICNDKPPAQYLATILWHKIFPEYLSQSDYESWKAGSARKTIVVKDTAAGFTDQLNQYMHDGNARETWVRDALDFLMDANLADRSGDKYHVKFRGFVRDVGEENEQEGTTELDKLTTLGEKFIHRYCEYTTSDSADVTDF